VIAQFAGQPIKVEHVVVRAGETMVVDLMFTLGRPDPIHVDFALLTKIDRYKPKSLSPQVAQIEGTVNDAGTYERIGGAVVTVVGPNGPNPAALQTVSDEQGRYKFERVMPGGYSVSTYYSTGGRQIEVRRSDVDVNGGEAVIVPLWIESTR
jgi:hypothetical protein